MHHTVELIDTRQYGMINQVYMVKAEEEENAFKHLSPAEGAKHSAKRLGRYWFRFRKNWWSVIKVKKPRTGGGVRRGFEGGLIIPSFTEIWFHFIEISCNRESV